MSETGAGDFLERKFSSADGLSLYARDYPARSETPLLPIVCLPGLTRSSRDFHALALLLSQHETAPRRVVTLDSRGRGNSQWDENKANYNLGIETGDVIAACAALDIERAIFIGTSRGGLILHLIAALKPELLEAVILNDIGPVIEAEGLMRIRDYLNRGRKPESWEEAVSLLRENHGDFFTALSPEDWRDFAEAVYRDVEGKPAGDFDPAIAEQLQAADFSKPLPDLWAQFSAFSTMPLMVIRGENSELLSEKTVMEMAARHPGMASITAGAQGHAPILHLGDLAAAIEAFISNCR